MGKPIFKRGESIEVEFTFLDVNDAAIDLSADDIDAVGAKLYQRFSNGDVLLASYSNLNEEGMKPIKVSDTPIDGSVLIVVDPDVSSMLNAGDYALQFSIRFDKSNNSLYPNGYDLKVLDRDEVLFSITN